MKKYKIRIEQIAEVESHLRATLSPVPPRPEFVKKLRHRLLDVSRPQIVLPKTNPKQHILLVFASIASGVFVVLTGIRTVLSIFGMLGLLRLIIRHGQEKRLTSEQLLG